jgi:2-C-methyl-D-erythritol 4-phosphate cytidylyltransferase
MGRPKAVIDLGGMPMIRHTLARFERIPDITCAVVVGPAGFLSEMRDTLVGLRWPGCEIRVVAGGSTRQESVRCGLEALAGNPEIVCVHDAARPLVSRATIERVLRSARETGAATAASRPHDSVREDVEGGSSRALDRSKLWLVETPQAFEAALLRRAHEHARATGLQATDDASLVEACAGVVVTIVPGEGWNPKITQPDDLRIVRQMLAV